MAQLAVEVPLDFLTSEFMESMAALQTVLGLEPEGRFLTPDEKSYLGEVFGSAAWWLDLVRIKEGFAGLFSSSPRPFDWGWPE